MNTLNLFRVSKIVLTKSSYGNVTITTKTDNHDMEIVFFTCERKEILVDNQIEKPIYFLERTHQIRQLLSDLEDEIDTMNEGKQCGERILFTY